MCLTRHAASEGLFKEELELELPCKSANFCMSEVLFLCCKEFHLSRVSAVAFFHCECAVFEMDEGFFSQDYCIISFFFPR